LGKLELLAGKVTADLTDCHSANGPVATAEFSSLLRAAVYADGVYLTETGESCANVTYDAATGFFPVNLPAGIRKVSGGAVESLRLEPVADAMDPTSIRYLSGFQRNAGTGESFVLSYAAASSGKFFQIDAQEALRYNTVPDGYSWENGWAYFPPGLFRVSTGRRVAGKPLQRQLPVYTDGQGATAGFIAPHDLEMDASGVLYLIDQSQTVDDSGALQILGQPQIRAIDPGAGYLVKTLDLAALGIQGEVRALDSDAQGRIHALTQRGDRSFSWYRLADGAQVDFSLDDSPVAVGVGISRRAPFTVAGNDLIVAISPGLNAATELYRVSGSDGKATRLTGTQTPATPQDLLDNPAPYAFPDAPHLKYGADGNLYIVLRQGVLVARDFK
jgi:hypothetical protein